MHLLQDRPHRLDQRFGQRGQRHAAAAGNEQLVVERMAQTRQHAAHRRLTEVDPAAGVGDALLCEQCVERDEQVQIEIVEGHGRLVPQHPTSIEAGRIGRLEASHQNKRCARPVAVAAEWAPCSVSRFHLPP